MNFLVLNVHVFLRHQVFSRIAIMSRGEMVFCGQPGEMVDFFSQSGYECPDYCNPFDIYGTEHIALPDSIPTSGLTITCHQP